jgi:hypothetical protein
LRGEAASFSASWLGEDPSGLRANPAFHVATRIDSAPTVDAQKSKMSPTHFRREASLCIRGIIIGPFCEHFYVNGSSLCQAYPTARNAAFQAPLRRGDGFPNFARKRSVNARYGAGLGL